jgi:hypothetical protein
MAEELNDYGVESEEAESCSLKSSIEDFHPMQMNPTTDWHGRKVGCYVPVHILSRR